MERDADGGAFARAWRVLGAGLVGAMATLPQAVAYGLIAFSPLGPGWAAAGIAAGVGSAVLFGLLTGAVTSNPLLLSGPRAVTAVVVAASIAAAQARGLDAVSALLVAFAGVGLAGLFQIAFGLLRLGQLVAYVPVPVLSGFVNASALLVLLTALPTALGLSVPSLQALLAGEVAPPLPWALAIGGGTILCIVLLEGRVRRLPAALVGIALGSLAYHIGVGQFGLPQGTLVGPIAIPDTATMPIGTILGGDGGAIAWSMADIALSSGLSIALLAAFDTILASNALDGTGGARSLPNRDLIVHGLANCGMGLTGFLPGSGTLMRSLAVHRAGEAGRAGNIAASLVFLGLILGLAPLVAALPLWAASGMLAATALLAFDRETPAKLAAILAGRVPYPRVVAGDVAITLTVMVTALAVDLIAAVGAGMALAALLFVLGMGRDPVRRVYSGAWVRSKVQRPQAHLDILQREGGRIMVMELQGALFFGACAAFARQIDAVLGQGVQHLILDCRHLSALDSTGASRLAELAERMRARGGQLILSHVVPERRRPENRRLRARRDAGSPPQQTEAGAPRPEREWTPRWVWLRLQATGTLSRLGPDGLADDTDAALARCEEALLRRFTRPVSGLSAVLADSPILQGLGPEPLGVLAGLAERRRYRAGAVVFREGEEGDAAFFLARGRMDVLIDIAGSTRRKRVSVLAAGSLFGELGLIDGRPRSATVRASEPSVCLVLPRAAVDYLERNRPDIILQLMRNVSVEMAGRLRGANAMISELER